MRFLEKLGETKSTTKCASYFINGLVKCVHDPKPIILFRNASFTKLYIHPTVKLEKM